jgi:hypothetical protein
MKSLFASVLIVVAGIGILPLYSQDQPAAASNSVLPDEAIDPRIAALRNDGFAAADASRITVAAVKRIENASNMVPAFTPDGKSFAYSQEEIGQDGLVKSVSIIVKDFETLKTIRTIPVKTAPFEAAFSPDGSMLAYLVSLPNSACTIHIVKADGKDIALPDNISTTTNYEIYWKEPNLITLFDRGHAFVEYLNLDTLENKVSDLGSDKANEINASLHSTTLAHPDSNVFQHPEWDLGYGLFVGDDKYNHLLTEDHSDYVYVSPDKRHVLLYFYKQSLLEILYLGVRSSPKKLFRIEIDITKALPKNEQEGIFQESINGHSLGRVYGGQLNPLNDKLAGANPQVKKGLVTIVEWHDTYAIVAATVEVIPIQVGDVVTEISAKNASTNWMQLQGWYQLEDVDSAAIPNAKSPPSLSPPTGTPPAGNGADQVMPNAPLKTLNADRSSVTESNTVAPPQIIDNGTGVTEPANQGASPNGAKPPTENQGANAMAAKISQESGGLLQLKKFTKTNGQKAVVNGVEMYTMDCTAQVIATQDCSMNGFMMGQWNGTFGAVKAQKNAGELDKFNPFGGAYAGNKQVAGGAIQNFNLSLHFELTERGWRTEGRIPADIPFIYAQVSEQPNGSGATNNGSGTPSVGNDGNTQFDGTWTGPVTNQVSRWGITMNSGSYVTVKLSKKGRIVSFPGNKNLPAINNVTINGNTLNFTNTFKSNNGKTTTTFVGTIQIINDSSISYSMHTANVPGGDSDMTGTLTRQ